VITDLEEYWEEEIEEEFFDAEGCVTARSLRSMGGENTTSGMSTVIMPRVTSRVERELLAAKQWVEETGFAEITDDEAWDTTMVTEYGDEIFIYMRELEVCLMIHLSFAS
jgi:G2/mitotic-specific cyclin 3/4